MMLGGLIVAAAVAVVTILIGDFNEITSRALGTVAVAMFYILLMLGIVSIATPKSEIEYKSSEIVVNISIVLALLSFFTSVFGIWNIIDGELALKLYFTYTVLLVTVLHSKFLFDIQQVYTKMKPYIYANYIFIFVVAAMLLVFVYVPERVDLLSGFYGRLLAASALIDATLSVIIGVMHRLYVQQHPELSSAQSARSSNIGQSFLRFIALFFLVFLLLRFIIGSL